MHEYCHDNTLVLQHPTLRLIKGFYLSNTTNLPTNATSASLVMSIGQRTITGLKAVNEDAVNSHIPKHSHALINKGIGLVIADGVAVQKPEKQRVNMRFVSS